jgi:hypothetical protein
MAQNNEDAAAKFAATNSSEVPYIRVSTFGTWKEFDNPRSAANKEAQRQEAEKAQRQEAEEAQRFRNAIETLKEGITDDLNYLQLETVIENHLLFPELDVNQSSEIYRLREKLYMLSLRHQTLQTVIQTRIISDKLDALQRPLQE